MEKVGTRRDRQAEKQDKQERKRDSDFGLFESKGGGCMDV